MRRMKALAATLAMIVPLWALANIIKTPFTIALNLVSPMLLGASLIINLNPFDKKNREELATEFQELLGAIKKKDKIRTGLNQYTKVNISNIEIESLRKDIKEITDESVLSDVAAVISIIDADDDDKYRKVKQVYLPSFTKLTHEYVSLTRLSQENNANKEIKDTILELKDAIHKCSMIFINAKENKLEETLTDIKSEAKAIVQVAAMNGHIKD